MADLTRDVAGGSCDVTEAARDVPQPVHALAATQQRDESDEADHGRNYSKHHASSCAALYRHLHNFTVAPAPHAWWP